ncbi:type III-B CRISPR-associated protein Cas10/Cmr2 [Rheinheimera sediminis]|uniref:type III-B CRISPR-associated protein Cas10/Cmr2 n=1 Tax=Rheinheimera sp. YQF-1 TaxID=2499626 RepID=UPI000FD776C6|nr:type III-B CRISPR-associated protein Cas10/Cmr2 [Rheinheimera sp. YQF-1]RVT47824.1 type III-B CRISPR-associated protein Cas10/Cmr2 [Rheinheimera sp. YQF-1]
MAQYLVTLALGPVQGLIEAARRTRDLWCGSWLLSEAAKAAALVLHQHQPGCLIFPCPANPKQELKPSERIQDDFANIANILRAEISADSEQAVRQVLEQAKQAAADRLADLCLRGRGKLSNLPFHEDIWNSQCKDILESFAAWVLIAEGQEGYANASVRLGGLLAARKATRDFVAAAAEANGLGFGIPKSSLDGSRESVINLSRDKRKDPQYRTALLKLGLGEGEELDALAVAKRMAGATDQFTAYSRIAADSWLETITAAAQSLDGVNKAYEALVEAGLATKVAGNNGIYNNMPYDAQMLFGFRLDNAITAAHKESQDDLPLLQAMQNELRALTREHQEPVPYAVILKADGDRMGELLSKASSAEKSRQISQALHGFAQQVRAVVRQYRGHAIYAGGDDVLALLPLQQALPCAQQLAHLFAEALNPVAEQLGVAMSERPTLSVGLGIGHLMQPLGHLRSRANAAEASAKGNSAAQPRNALAIQLGIRGGAEVSFRCRWDDPQSLDFLQKMTEAYQSNQCPSRLAYELRAIGLRLSWAKAEEPQPLPGIHAAELSRTLARKRQSGGEGELSSATKALLAAQAEKVGLLDLADSLIIARWLSARTAQDLGAMQ